MENKLSLTVSLTIGLLLASCASKTPFYSTGNQDWNTPEINQKLQSSNIDYELYLVGDIGLETNIVDAADIVSLIKSELKTDNDNQAVVFLGNSFSKNGLPDEEDPKYDQIVKSTQFCLEELRQKTKKVYFIPGNNEWSDGKNYTVDALQSTEDFLESFADGKNIVVPSDGCGEPKEVELTDDLVLVLMDSQWLIQGDENDERKRSGCEIDDNIEFITYMQEVVASNKRKNIVIAAHHPVIANGKTAGNYSAKDHLLPLPILGTIITGIKKIAGSEQQFGHPDYEAYRSAMMTSLQNCEGCITVSGHENSMQYFLDGTNHFVIAGSGSKVDYAREGDGASFSYMKQGFTKITHTKDLELWLEFYVPDEQNPGKAKPIFRKLLHKKKRIDFDDKNIYKGSEEYPETKKVKASEIYGKKRFLRGNFYRKAWDTEIDVPILLLDKVYGGLKPIQQGGGFQTQSLRLENPKGEQWVLRSIYKNVEKVVPPALRGTFAQNLVQDGIAASHPYGAFVIPVMAEAAGIYHANPKVVYVPHQKALGEYDLDFAERLYLFEERPGGNTSERADYGNTEKTVNTPKLIENLAKNHKHRVDQQAVLRARLFDVWIGDWDRHDDQWRWATFKKDGKTIYRPVPRDRDQVFFKNDGVLDYLSGRPFFAPQLRIFKDDVDYYPGLIFNARHFDRTFMNALNREDFIAMAKDLQQRMTDEVIDEAFKLWPQEIRDLDEAEIKRKLKSRRAKWVEYAGKHYDHIYKEVTIPGTYDKDIFEVESLPNNKLSVTVYHEKKTEKHKIYSHIIDGNVTKEVRLFGLKKKDQFTLTGTEKSSIKIRIIGGSGGDQVNNNSKGLNVIVYDRPDGMTLTGNAVKSEIKDEDGINSYDRKDWKLDRFLQFPMITFYTDEGIGMSYNIWWKKYGFRTNPYKSNNTLSFAYFWANRAFIAKYNGHFPNALGNKWDFGLNVLAAGPTFTQFFYGLGNEYINFGDQFPEINDASSRSFHIVKGTRIDINPQIVRSIGKTSSFRINPSFEFFNLKDSDDDPRFYLLPESSLPAFAFEEKLYGALGLGFNSTRIDNAVVPTRGFIFDVNADYKLNLKNSDFSNLTLTGNLTTYVPFDQQRTVVIASNIGGAYTWGDTEFFHVNYLASPSRLRGFRSNRFAGEGIFYHATDLRIQVSKGRGAFPVSLGIFGSFDYGRAWFEGDDFEGNDADKWHTSFGGGIFLTPLDMIGFKLGYYVGRDDTQLSIGGALSF